MLWYIFKAPVLVLVVHVFLFFAFLFFAHFAHSRTTFFVLKDLWACFTATYLVGHNDACPLLGATTTCFRACGPSLPFTDHTVHMLDAPTVRCCHRCVELFLARYANGLLP